MQFCQKTVWTDVKFLDQFLKTESEQNFGFPHIPNIQMLWTNLCVCLHFVTACGVCVIVYNLLEVGICSIKSWRIQIKSHAFKSDLLLVKSNRHVILLRFKWNCDLDFAVTG